MIFIQITLDKNREKHNTLWQIICYDFKKFCYGVYLYTPFEFKKVTLVGDDSVFEMVDQRSFFERFKSHVWSKLTNRPFFYFGAKVLRIHPDSEQGYISFCNATDIMFDDDGSLWFNYLKPPQDEKLDDSVYNWPERLESENPVEYRERCAAIDGMEERRVNYAHYESHVYVGYYCYTPSGEVEFELKSKKSKEAVKKDIVVHTFPKGRPDPKNS